MPYANETGSSYPNSPSPRAETGDPSETYMPDMHDLGERASELGSEISEMVKKNPVTTIAIAAGLAFAVGALWKAGRSSPPSHLDALRSRLPDLPSAKQLRAYWR
jgi:hypothetical protein